MREPDWILGKPIKADIPAEVRDELEFHLAMRVRELEASGLSPEAARREALLRLGDLTTLTQTCRQLGESRERRMSLRRYAAELSQDVRIGLRQCVRSARFTLVTVLTLGLGIGATTSIFSAVYGILLRPLSYPAPERLVVPQSRDRITGNRWNVTWADYLDWRQAGVFQHLALYERATLNIVRGGEPERLESAFVTDEFFTVIGLPPVLGQLPGPDLFRPGSGRIAVISYGLWQRAFGGARDVVGQTLTIIGVPVEIMAVMPAGFFPDQVDLWLPNREGPSNPADRDNYVFAGVARLAPGQSLDATRARLATMARQVEQEHPRERADVTVTAEPLLSYLVGSNTSRMLWVLLGAVGFVLLIGCVNVANLLLGRSVARTRELAIRGAIGAGRGRLVRQLLTESAVLGLLGGVLGVVLAWGGVRLLVAFAPPDVPRLDRVELSLPALGFALAISLLAAFIFGLVPALRVKRMADATTLTAGEARSTTGVRGRRMLHTLVGSELALSLLLLIGAGLFARSFLRLLQSSPGFTPGGLLTFQISLQGERYRSDTVTTQTFAAMAGQLRTIPGVTEVSGATSLPVGGGGYYLGRSFLPEGRPEPPEGQEVSAQWTVVLPGFFRTLGIPMIRGRDFHQGDETDGAPVMIVSRLFARRMFNTDDVIGRRVRSWRDENLYREIVGVVDDVRIFSAGDSLGAMVYVPHAQNPWWGLMSLVMRTAVSDAGMVPAVRQAVQSVDPALAPSDLRWMDDVLRDSRAPQRVGTFLMLVFAALALVLAVVGIYGVLSYLVANRSREIGIRMALGASRSGVVGMVLREALLLVVLGTAVGLAAALLLTRSVSSLLFEVPAVDLMVFTGVPVLLALVALAASWAPARRASKVDPLIAIRNEA